MKLSETTRTLIDELYQPVGLIQKLTGKSRSKIDILEDIRKTGQPLALLHICQVLSVAPSAASRKASEVVDEFMSHMPLERFSWLDQQIRERSYSCAYKSPPWQNISPKLVGIMSIARGTEISILGLASMQKSGYVRESAIYQLNKNGDGRELPYLLLRLNDWVAPVREKAKAYVTSRIRPDYAPYFANCLGLVHHLLSMGRTSQKDIVASVNALLQSSACKDSLMKGLTSSDKMVKRMSFKLAADSTAHDRLDICKLALLQEDAVVRLWAARTVVQRWDTKLAQLLPEMRSDPFMPVRREALLGCMKLSGNDAIDQLQNGLLDVHSSTRELCRFYLNERGMTDFAGFYRQVSSDASGSRLQGIIAGLGEVGNIGDILIIKKALEGNNARLRKVAIVALAKLLRDDAISELLPYLSDESLAVSRLVSRMLGARIESVRCADLWQIYRNESRLTPKKHILSLIGMFNRWVAFPYLLQAHCQDDSDQFRAGGQQLQLLLSKWNESFTNPTKEQINGIKAVLRQVYVKGEDPLVKESVSILARYVT